MTYARTTTVDAAPAGDTVKQGVLDVDTDLTGIYANLNTHETATTGIHGAGSGTLVSTTGTQTLTAKTISGATITGAIECSGATLSTPTITGATISGATITGAVDCSGATLTSPTVSGATITGTIAASGATISGATITGGTIAGVTFSPTLTSASDTAYGASWDNVTDVAPSKNAVYDKIETLMAKTGSNLAIGSDADGDMYYRASSVLARLAKGTANYKMFMNAEATAPEWASSFNIGTFSRDVSAETGDVSYTGVGFKPSAILFMAFFSGVSNSVGWGNGPQYATARQYNLNGVISFDGILSYCIYISPSVGCSQRAKIKSMDADGFTLAWTKVGSPTGTLYVSYLALR